VRYLYSDEVDISKIPKNKRHKFVEFVGKLAPEHLKRVQQLMMQQKLETTEGYVISIMAQGFFFLLNKLTWGMKI